MSINRFRQLMAAAGGGSDFYAKAVTFNGSTQYLTRGADLTSNADSKVGIFSCWLKFNASGDANQNNIYATTQSGVPSTSGQFFVFRSPSGSPFFNRLNVFGQAPDDTAAFNVVSDDSFTSADGWVHLLASWDLANNLAHMYINDVVNESSSNKNNKNVDYTKPEHAVGSSSVGATKFAGDMAELYLNNDEYIDITVEANRRKFISALGKPVDLGSNGQRPTGASPIVYLGIRDGDASSVFAVNKGTGGNFTVNGGVLSIASTSPSD